jgi:electron transfer flavoprotein alpha subunit
MDRPQRLPRVDPRRPAIVTPAGLRRIVLGSSEGDRHVANAAAGAAAHRSVKPVRSARPFSRCILVVAHADRGTLGDHAREVIAAAALLSADDVEIVAAVLGSLNDDAAALGIDRCIVWPDFDRAHYQPERSVQWLRQLRRALQPITCLMADADADGELGRRFAVADGLDLACPVVELTADRLRMRATAREDELRSHAEVMLLARHVADAKLPFVGLGLRSDRAQGAASDAQATADLAAIALEPPPVHIAFGLDPRSNVRDLGLVAGDPQTLALEEADFILAAGNGVTDLTAFNALALAVGAATGASRVAVDDGRFPRAKQIGASGKTVAATGYLALGISGAVQHLQGIKDCRHVIAVNTDAAAPIVRRANLTVVEDSGALMAALLSLVDAEKTREAAT